MTSEIADVNVLIVQLGTDMKQHFSQVSLFNTRLASSLNQRSTSGSSGGGSASVSPLASANASSSGVSTLHMVLDDDSRGLALLVRMDGLTQCHGMVVLF